MRRGSSRPSGLSPWADGYAAWLVQREREIGAVPEALRGPAEGAVFRARIAHRRIAAGIRLLTDPESPRHKEALRAFRFANEAMAMQRRHTEIALRRADPMVSYADAEADVRRLRARAASWRPFQLAFVLLNLPAITDPDHTERG